MLKKDLLKMYIEGYKDEWEVARYSIRCGKEVRTVLFCSHSYDRCKDFIEYRKQVHEGTTEKQVEKRKEYAEKQKEKMKIEREKEKQKREWAMYSGYSMKDIMEAYNESIEWA